MAKSDLQATQQKWVERVSVARAHGIPDSAWRSLAAQDITSVKQGHTPMADAEVNDAIRSAIGLSPIKDPTPQHDSPLDVIGNIPSDLGGILTGMFTGIPKYFWSLKDQMGDLYTLYTGTDQQKAKIAQQYGLKFGSDIGGPGDLFTSIGNMPVVGPLLPVVHTTGALLSDTGRKQLEEHPVGGLLDVLPAFAAAGGELAKLGGAGAEAASAADAATAAGEAGAAGTAADAATAAADTSRLTAAEKVQRAADAAESDPTVNQFDQINFKPSAREAFLEHHPIRGTFRAGIDTLSKVPRVGKTLDREAINHHLFNLGMNNKLIEHFTAEFERAKSGGERAHWHWMRSKDGPLSLMEHLPPEDAKLLHDVSRGTATPAEQEAYDARPDLQTIHDSVKTIQNDTARRLGMRDINLPGVDGPIWYPEKARVTRAFDLTQRAYTTLEAATAKLDKIRDRVTKHEGKLATHKGKIRKLNEPAEDFAARAEEPITPAVIREAAGPVTELFVDGNPLDVLAQGLENAPGRIRANVVRDINKLSGDNGLFAQLDNALATGDVRAAKAAITQIKNVFKHSSWNHTKYGSVLLHHTEELGHELNGMTKRVKSMGGTMQNLSAAYRDYQTQLNRVETLTRRTNSIEKRFKELQLQDSPMQYDAVIAEGMKADASQIAMVKYRHNQIELNNALQKIEESHTFKELADAIGKEHADTWIAESRAMWQTIAKSGVDPIWMPNVNPQRLDYLLKPTVLPDTFYKAPAAVERNINMGTSIYDTLAAVTEAHRQLIGEQVTQHMVEITKTWTKDKASLLAHYRDIVRNMPRAPNIGINAQAIEMMNREWAEFDPSHYGIKEYFPSSGPGSDLMVPKGIQNSLKYMTGEKGNMKGFPAYGAWDKTNKIWRFSVLTTPRHLVHVAIGGLVMAAGAEPGMLLHLKEAFGIVHRDEEAYLNYFNKHVNDVNTIQLWHHATGKTIGRVLVEAMGSPIKAMNWLEENAAQTYKVASMLSGEARGLRQDEAIRLANKITVDMNAMTPFERTVLRNVFPFYGFTRHLFRYIMTYPSDHPMRAAILANFAEAHQKDWNSGLPQSFQFLFFLGQPDSQGNVTSLDFRGADPFRSFANNFTLAGITSQMNPIAQFVGQEAGINVLSATPELYPQVHYDPYTGSMVADRPANPLVQAAEFVVPETQSVDALIGLTDNYRNLARTNPDAFRRRVYSALGMLPVIPQEMNVPLEIESSQRKRYKDAQQSISAAIQTGDFTKAKRYDYVPIPSLMKRFFGQAQYATPGDIEKVWQSIEAGAAARGMGGVSVHAFLPKPTRTRTPVL